MGVACGVLGGLNIVDDPRIASRETPGHAR